MAALGTFAVGGEDRPLTGAEVEFLTALAARCSERLDVWRHRDPDGAPWLMVSLDLVDHGSIAAVARLDVDERGVRGGWSPALLNWDDGVRAEAAGIDLQAPDSLPPTTGDPDELATVAARWFGRLRASWPAEDPGSVP